MTEPSIGERFSKVPSPSRSRAAHEVAVVAAEQLTAGELEPGLELGVERLVVVAKRGSDRSVGICSMNWRSRKIKNGFPKNVGHTNGI